MNGFAKSLLPIRPWQACLLLTSVALFLAWSMRLRGGVRLHRRTFAMARSEMPLLT